MGDRGASVALSAAFVAPYAAVFMVNDTVYRSLTTAVRQVATLVAGQLLAFVTIAVVHDVDAAVPIVRRNPVGTVASLRQ